MKGILKQLAEKRRKADEAKAKEAELLKVVQESNEWEWYQNAQVARKTTEEEILSLEAQVREEGLKVYRADPSKKKFDGFEVKEFDVVTISDEQKAKEWLLKSYPSLLPISATASKKFIGLEVDWATTKKEPRVQISSKLDCFLEE